MSLIDQADRDELSQEQRKMIETFESDYNTVDKLLRTALELDRRQGFASVVQQYAERKRYWNYRDLLLLVADVRNAIVHNKTNQIRYVAVPTPTLAARLAACRASLESPKFVLPAFKRPVDSIAMDESLSSILKRIAKCDYSQFPVYQDTSFKGLLTENGITRWLAKHVNEVDSIVEFEDVPARSLLRFEEKRKNFDFIPRNHPLDELPILFADNPDLEAVFITESGKPTEKLQGIATQWDCLQLKKARKEAMNAP